MSEIASGEGAGTAAGGVATVACGVVSGASEPSGRIVATYVSAGAETAAGVLACAAWLAGGAAEGASVSIALTFSSAVGAAPSVSASDMAPANVTSTNAASARIKRRD